MEVIELAPSEKHAQHEKRIARDCPGLQKINFFLLIDLLRIHSFVHEFGQSLTVTPCQVRANGTFHSIRKYPRNRKLFWYADISSEADSNRKTAYVQRLSSNFHAFHIAISHFGITVLRSFASCCYRLLFIFTFFRLDKSFSNATLDSASRVDRLQALAFACERICRNACFISACLAKFDLAKASGASRY